MQIDNCHQPYYANDKLFCVKKKVKSERPEWKLSIEGVQEIDVEGFDSICSPVIHEDSISFIGQIWNNKFYESSMYKGKLDLEEFKVKEITNVESNVRYGFCIGEMSVKEEEDARGFSVNGGKTIYLPGDIGITRIVPAIEIKNSLLITGSRYLNNFSPVTLVYNLEKEDFLGELKVEGESIYKSCLCELGCFHAIKVSKDFEDRAIVLSRSWSVENS